MDSLKGQKKMKEEKNKPENSAQQLEDQEARSWQRKDKLVCATHLHFKTAATEKNC